MLKNGSAQKLLKETLEDIQNQLLTENTLKRSSTEQIYSFALIRNSILSLTSQKLRRTYKYYLHYKDKYPVNRGEKYFSLDFLQYVIDKNPDIPFHIFPQKDHLEIKQFVKNKFLTALLDTVDYELLSTSKNEPKMDTLSECYKYISKAKSLQETAIIDCGAYDGESSKVLSNQFQAQKILALEPDKTNFHLLKKNILKNNLTKINPLNIGIGDKRKTVMMSKSGSGEALISSSGTKAYIETIDELVKDKHLTKIGLIKMDVEGSELPAIKGASQTIKRHKPVLIISLYHRGQDFFEIPAFLRRMVPKYHFRFVNADPFYATLERLLIAEV